MKRAFLFIILFLSVLLLSACDVQNMGSLPDLSKPYTGMYECEKISLGSTDMTERFEFIRIELEQDGSFSLVYRTAEGNEGGYTGEYSVDTEREEITFSAKTGLRKSAYTFPMRKGAILVDYNLFGNLLHAEFTMP